MLRRAALLLLLSPPAWAQTHGHSADPPGEGLDWSALLAGRWRVTGNPSCGAGYGTIGFLGDALRFEWRLPNRPVNVAIERIDALSGNTVQTTVISDVGTSQPQVGHQFRYEFWPDQWTSYNLTSGQRARHVRC